MSGKEIRRFSGVVDEIRCLARSGGLVATGGVVNNTQPGTVRLWDFETGKEVRTLHGHNRCVTSVAFSPDGKMLASSSWDKTVRLWDVATGKELKSLIGHQDNAEYAAFTSDGKRVVSCGNIYNPTLRLWDVATGKQLLETEAVKEGFFCVATLPNSPQCLSTGRDGVFRLWQWKR